MSPLRPVVVGTRGGALALRQTQEVLERLLSIYPRREFRVSVVHTSGDRDRTTPLASLGRGIFVKELEVALLAGTVDLAVHSLKDLPSQTPEGLVVAAVGERVDPRDALVSKGHRRLEELPPGARVGTSSPRRTAQLRALRPDLEVVDIRGNVTTRLGKLKGSDYDAVILAAAGLLRLGLESHVAEYLDPQVFIPPPGQGALAMEARAADEEVMEIVSCVDHPSTRAAVTAERAFLEALGGGCKVPIAAYAEVHGAKLRVSGMVATEDGRRVVRSRLVAPVTSPEEAGRRLGRQLLEMEAGDILEEVAP